MSYLSERRQIRTVFTQTVSYNAAAGGDQDFTLATTLVNSAKAEIVRIWRTDLTVAGWVSTFIAAQFISNTEIRLSAAATSGSVSYSFTIIEYTNLLV